MKEIGSIIKENRIKKEMTQQDLASILFVTKQAISKWENNKGMPDISLMQPLSELLGISVDTLLGGKSVTRKINVFRYIILFIVFAIGTLLLVMVKDYYAIQNFVKDIETKTVVDLPKARFYKTIDFSDWEAYGNSVSINTMSYVIFYDNLKLRQFEKNIEDNINWMSDINPSLTSLMPMEILNYVQNGDYFLLYNIDLGSYNSEVSDSVRYNYIFMIYQKEDNRLLIFEYSH